VLLTGWGRTAPTAPARIARPGDESEVAELLAAAPARGVIARGLGRSYGDAAQAAGGTVLDMTGLSGVVDIDERARTVDALAGTSLDALMRALLPRGLFVPVTPGTRQVTLGGAIACDVHGKNHHRDGSLGAHVAALTLATPGGVLELSPGTDAEAFDATVGGMGLTGVVTRARLRLRPVATSRIRVDTDRAGDLDELLALMASDDAYRYSVAWIDGLARGARLGRGVLTRGDHAEPGELDARAGRDPLAFAPRGGPPAPPWAPGALLNRTSMAAFNALWFHRAPRRERGRIQPLAAFFHPLDGISGWNRLYGPSGLVQYQSVVPLGAEDVLRAQLERLSAAGAASFLGVLKRFGPGGSGHLSFPREGWTLALDVPAAAPGLGPLLDGLDELVAAAGGRVYLAKDGRLRPELVEAMYPRLDAWRAERGRLDPDGVLRSDLDRRLGLTA
jgi:decaprenylphospho-beta-D-ribofuranose 2-oxidase